jgi:hypothetical protein
MHNKLIRLVLATLVLVLLAFWVGGSRSPEDTIGVQQALIPGLAEAINDIQSIKIVGAQEQTLVTLAKKDRGWVVLEKSNYPADMTKVREFLLKLANAHLLEKKTADAVLHEKLGLEDIKTSSAKGVLVELEGLVKPTKIIVGNFNSNGGESTFIRYAGEAQSYLAKGNLAVDKSTANWLMRELIDVPATRIARVQIIKDQKVVNVFKAEETQAHYQLQDIPVGRQAVSEQAVDDLASGLASFRLDDVMPAQQLQLEPNKLQEAKYLTFDGLVVEAKLGELNGKNLANFTASLDEQAAAIYIEKAQASARSAFDAEKAAIEDAKKNTQDSSSSMQAKEPIVPLAVSDAAKDRQNRLSALHQEAAELNKRLQAWTFVIPSYKYSAMSKTLDDLLKPIADAKTTPLIKQ